MFFKLDFSNIPTNVKMWSKCANYSYLETFLRIKSVIFLKRFLLIFVTVGFTILFYTCGGAGRLPPAGGLCRAPHKEQACALDTV